jgi:putative oxidoreductase
MGSIREQVNAMYNQEAPPLPEPLGFAAGQMAVAWGELLGGIALLLGAATRIAAVGVLVIQLGAIFTVTYQQGFSFASGGGYEYNLALVAMCLALIVLGSGPLSFDHWFAQRRKESAAVSGAAPVAGVAS